MMAQFSQPLQAAFDGNCARWQQVARALWATPAQALNCQVPARLLDARGSTDLGDAGIVDLEFVSRVRRLCQHCAKREEDGADQQSRDRRLAIVASYAAPIKMPTPSTMTPPSTTWNTACRNGVSM